MKTGREHVNRQRGFYTFVTGSQKRDQRSKQIIDKGALFGGVNSLGSFGIMLHSASFGIHHVAARIIYLIGNWNKTSGSRRKPEAKGDNKYGAVGDQESESDEEAGVVRKHQKSVDSEEKSEEARAGYEKRS
ncbi:hypothetical protein DSL72_003313 [Monilinia vaccinii-corymbosi]|uniref:Uncharacterized protein n=1 Tax=Monilinia vaccinii-corymbosi TaxID=61207 RepID=A0A8A3P5N5_9HELO|nr:hypothetical protein DSL72_003313 [Monilinia vaccinii-corymbosi]